MVYSTFSESLGKGIEMVSSQNITFSQFTSGCHYLIVYLSLHRLSFIEYHFFQSNELSSSDETFLVFDNLPIKPGFPWKELCAEEEIHMFMSINPKETQYFHGPKLQDDSRTNKRIASGNSGYYYLKCSGEAGNFCEIETYSNWKLHTFTE